MDTDFALKIGAFMLTVASLLVTGSCVLTLWRPHREQRLNAQLTFVREAWAPLAEFRLKVRHWADGVVNAETFLRDVNPLFEATLSAFHRAQLVMEPETVSDKSHRSNGSL